jgi:DNA-binding beta-propeller fold protein YncE/cytochrome c553
LNINYFLLVCCLAFSAQASEPVEQNYATHCASCHGVNRLGGIGPALLPENLERLRRPEASKAIAQGRVASQMLGFADKLSKDEIEALTGLIYTALPETPVWNEPEISASRIQYAEPLNASDKPMFKADPLNLFVVVELGDHHATILDGDKLEPIFRFQTRFALHGGPKFSPDGRYVYFASRDGWISKFDIYNQYVVAEVRAGINSRNLAVSGDGKTILVGNYLPHTLVLLNADDLSLLKIIPAVGLDGKSSRVSAVYQAQPRGSFIAALKDVKEVWEIPYTLQQQSNGFQRSYDPAVQAMVVGARTFPVRRIVVDDYLDDFFFDQSYQHLISTARDAKKGHVLDLDTGKKVADLDLPGMPHLGSGITWEYQGHQVMATPNTKEGEVTVIDMQTWQTIKHIKTPGPGFFMRSHENARYAWTDGFATNDASSRDTMTLIDKNTLEVAHVLRPAPGKTAAHVEFTRDGKYALVSIWEMEGELVIYDTDTLQVVKRIPMKKPSGKYNVYNKITRSSGTSH